MNEVGIQIAPDSTGKAIDSIALVAQDGVTTVYRQAVALADPDNSAQVTKVIGGLLQVSDVGQIELLTQILVELRVISSVLYQALMVGQTASLDLSALRQNYLNYGNTETP